MSNSRYRYSPDRSAYHYGGQRVAGRQVSERPYRDPDPSSYSQRARDHQSNIMRYVRNGVRRINRRRRRRAPPTTIGGPIGSYTPNQIRATICVAGPSIATATASSTINGIIPLGVTLAAAADYSSFGNLFDEIMVVGGLVTIIPQQQANTGYIVFVYDNDDNTVTLVNTSAAASYRNKIILQCVQTVAPIKFKWRARGISGNKPNWYNTALLSSSTQGWLASMKTYGASLAVNTNFFQTLYHFYCVFRTRR
jgi:hypothetical protein